MCSRRSTCRRAGGYRAAWASCVRSSRARARRAIERPRNESRISIKRREAEMTQSTSLPPPAVSKNVVARLFGVLFSPRATYADVAASPRWLGALLIVVVITGGSTFAFLSTEVGKTAMLDQQMRTMESFGVKVNDQAVERMENSAGRAPYFGAVTQAVVLPIAAAALAGVLFAIFNAMLGGDAKYKQVFAVVVYSGAIVALGALFVLP